MAERNPFDQFDAPAASGPNPFDQFDTAPPWEQFKDETGAPAVPPWEQFAGERGDAPAIPGAGLAPDAGGGTFSALAGAYGRLQGLGARATFSGATKGALSPGTLLTDALVNVGYGAHKLAAKTGAVNAPDPDAYYGKGGGYLPTTAAIGDAVDAGMDRVAAAVPGVGRYMRAPETAGERLAYAPAEAVAGAMGGVGLGRVVGGAPGGFLAGRPALQAASAAASGEAGQAVQEVGGTPEASLAASLLAGGAVGAAGARATRPAAPGPRPTADIERAASDAYARSKGEGVVYRNAAGVDLENRIRGRLRSEDIYADTSPEVRRVLDPISRSVMPDAAGVRSDIPLERMEVIRQQASKMRSSPDPQVRRSGAILADEVGGFMGERNAAHVTPGSGNVGAAVDALEEARAGYRHARQASALDTAIDKADLRRKSTGTGTNYNTTRQNLRAIVENPESKAFRQFDAPQIAAMRDYVEGSATQNGLRFLSSFAPKGTVSNLTGIVAAKAGFGALPMAGFLGKTLHDRLDARKLSAIESLVKDGPAGPRPRPSAQFGRNTARGLGQGFLAGAQPDERRSRYR